MSEHTQNQDQTKPHQPLSEAKTKDFLTVLIEGQMFGIPILQVQDVLGELKVTRIPLAPPQVSGSLNLRGRIVTAIDVRKCLGLPPMDVSDNEKRMSVVVNHDDELYSLIIDNVGDVLPLQNKDFEPNPATLDIIWKSISLGVYRLDGKILVVLDVPKLLLSLQHPN
ncbi:MAG: chemotaxis protein CheW [Alphaproteobacteria bacterium]|nr:chemotaxis protein CheW [Alphaproteobacteria bacterium]MCB1550397.1 chemotaxis protein CheW [Alphaproteobacteria bacterium]MCB9985296.1 chemotaxis protein CheW [Micavibrio sp.]HRK98205.1 chemotaxis protein CheW [Alphaproteobacteria bacterium]